MPIFKNQKWKDALIALLGIAVIVLLAIIFVPHRNDMAPVGGMADMPGMTLKTFNVMPGEPVPTVAFTITKDALDGWDLHIITTNFTFTPEDINKAPVAGDGHVHLYVDGKLTVVFSPWYHLDDLPLGTHDIRVTLNNNDHSVYAVNGTYIQAEQTVLSK